MPSTINKFKDEFRGGVRANLFRCDITAAGVGFISNKLEFHAKGTSIPASTIGNIDVPYQGRQLKVPGDRTYADWTVTVFNDEGMSLRHQFEHWMMKIQNHGTNYQEVGYASLYGDGTVTQLNRKGSAVSSYSINMYPTEVAAIDLAWDSNDAVEEYAVTFAVNWWMPGVGGITATSGDKDTFKWKIGGSIDSEGNKSATVQASKTFA